LGGRTLRHEYDSLIRFRGAVNPGREADFYPPPPTQSAFTRTSWFAPSAPRDYFA